MGHTQPLFRGVTDFTMFGKLMNRLNVETETVYVSLIVFSGHLGRKLSINTDAPLATLFPTMSGLQQTYTMDDQNNTLRFAQYRNGVVYMTFILNRNGVVTARYFTDSMKEFEEEVLVDMKTHIQRLMCMVLDVS
jgi:hypothetical protein